MKQNVLSWVELNILFDTKYFIFSFFLSAGKPDITLGWLTIQQTKNIIYSLLANNNVVKEKDSYLLLGIF